MKILISTDTWYPAVNGVVRVLEKLKFHLEAMGHEVVMLEPSYFKSVRFPFYPEVKLSFVTFARLEKLIPKDIDAIHIAVEGPIGWVLRWYCASRKIPFTSAYHTDWSHYICTYLRVPFFIMKRAIRWWHSAPKHVLVGSESVIKKLESWGITNSVLWPKAVDVNLFTPRKKSERTERILLFVGRCGSEKNIEAFLRCKVAGSKVVVGDGPMRTKLEDRYPEVKFLGCLEGQALADVFSTADVFVFPSKTDTFGLVILEALASGVPVAAFPVQGPIDLITDPRLGALSWDLEEAIERASSMGDGAFCRKFALKFSWEQCALSFLKEIKSSLILDPKCLL